MLPNNLLILNSDFPYIHDSTRTPHPVEIPPNRYRYRLRTCTHPAPSSGDLWSPHPVVDILWIRTFWRRAESTGSRMFYCLSSESGRTLEIPSSAARLTNSATVVGSCFPLLLNDCCDCPGSDGVPGSSAPFGGVDFEGFFLLLFET
jgi:hypothetical protein